MAVLNDIEGYWNLTGSRMIFYEDHMWEGSLLLEDDGWFEGIVKDKKIPYDGDIMIFGFYYPEKSIKLIKVAPSDISDPFIFRGERDAKGYEGEFSVLGLVEEVPYGESYIITQDVEELKKRDSLNVIDRDVDAEKEDLMRRIEAFKAENDFQELYKTTFSMRKKLAGKHPIYDTDVQDAVKEIKTFIKEMEPSYFEDCEELAFVSKK